MVQLNYELIRTRRKTLAIHIKECRVIVRAPIRTPVREIDRFVASKTKWIEKHLTEQRKRAEQHAALMPGEAEKKRLISFYKRQAEKIIPDRVAYFARLIGARPTDIRIGSAKRSWGSCSSSGKLTFSWRLMMASPDAIDYVIVHELAHLKHLNHSKAFWSIVERIMPNWKEYRKELHLLQKTIPF